MTRRILIVCLLVLTVGIAVGVVLWPPFHSSLRTRLVDALSQHFKGDVQLGSLEVSLFPTLTASGTKLVIANPDPSAPAPIIAIESFQAEGSLLDLARRSLHFHRVALKGLQVHIPPKRIRKEQKVSVRKIARSDLLIDELVSEDGNLVIDTEKPGHDPLTFEIHRIKLEGFAFDRPTTYEATLINAVPPGEVEAHGQFGPWNPDEPRATPVSGDYLMAKADLGVFEGLAGLLSSRGTFEGPLERLAVRGTTTTPDFLLTKSGQPVKLDTTFDAVVDGTNGDTILNQVNATLLKTTILARGKIIRVREPQKGHLIDVDATIDQGRIEDVMRLAVKKEPPMTGVLGLKASVHLPPGKGEVLDRLELAGLFSVGAGKFASDVVQQKLSDLSRRARGEPDEPLSTRVFSNLKGTFQMRHAVLTLPAIAFSVDGAIIDLSGTYDIRQEALDFAGTVRLQAKLSETVSSGIKSFLLKPLDSLFKGKNSGTELPIQVQGTVDQPKFGVNVKRAITKH